MRLLVISDVHADSRALDCVLEHADRHCWDELLFLGDAVGYGSQPRQAVSRLRELPLRAGILGNHESMLNSLRNGQRPNASHAVVDVLARHLTELGAADLEFLDGLEGQHLDITWGAVHGAVRKPFEYLISVPLARANASHMKRDIYFVGHTHVPVAYLERPDRGWSLCPFGPGGGTVNVPPGVRAFLNPGSVSLPRDGLAGSSYGIFDEGERTFSSFRVR